MTAVTATRNASGTPDRPYDEVDLSSRAFWAGTMRDRDASFRLLREQRPVTWHRPFEDQLLDDPDDHGFWAIVTYDDLVEVTKRHEDFLSGHGILLESLPADIVEAGQGMIAMDPPRHTQLRRLVAKAFTPKQMARIADMVAANATRVVDRLQRKAGESPDGVVDFVHACSSQLPMHNISDMMGLPEGKRQEAAAMVAIGVGWNDPENTELGTTKEEKIATMAWGQQYLHTMVAELAEERRRTPTDDLISSLANAEIDGERLTAHEIGAFFVLLTIAGTDTTQQSISHGLQALTEHPEQREWLLADLPGRIDTAVEEFVRWATPIINFRRTAARDMDFRGQKITKGDKVVLFYSSANRDETRIERPWEFDLSRDPNPHVTFGGGGIHHCLGNQLARQQIKALWTELLSRHPQVASVGDPVLRSGNFFNQVKQLPCSLRPE